VTECTRCRNPNTRDIVKGIGILRLRDGFRSAKPLLRSRMTTRVVRVQTEPLLDLLIGTGSHEALRWHLGPLRARRHTTTIAKNRKDTPLASAYGGRSGNLDKLL
jgi:hypothetical protein